MVWPAGGLPTFTDGMTVDEGEMDPLVEAIDDLQDSGRWLRGKWIQKAGNFLASTTAASETDLPDMVLDNVPIISGKVYLFFYNIYLNVTTSSITSSWLFRARQNTALSGAVVVDSMHLAPPNPSGAADGTHVMMLPWKASSSGTMSFYLSVHRFGGSNSIALRGDGRTAGGVMQAGDDTTIWTTVT